MRQISLYWKCQLIGWLIFALLVSIREKLMNEAELFNFIPLAIRIFVFGLMSTHLLKITIKKLGILKKKFAMQVISLLALSILFSAATVNFVNMGILMITTDFWGTDTRNFDEQIPLLFKTYIYDLVPVLLTISGWLFIYFLFHYVKGVRNEERLRMQYELQMVALEAKALRSQMNPHFIFNCMNSIKSLMQENKVDKGITYLTTFSKLIRTLFTNADKKEITLHDEIETCKLYLQLEAMRFDAKFAYHINIDETIDMKSISVPALIVQPFIENAIWHGIVPRGEGGNVSLDVCKRNGNIEIIVDDNGIGRESSQQNKTVSIGHQSKGVNLTQSRLELDNLLQQRQAKLRTIDKKDEYGKASGTRVIIELPQEE